MSLYNLKSDPSGQFRCTKFSKDLDVESSYLVSDEACECPQFVNRDKRCRHQKMLKHFFKGQTIRVDTSWFYDYEADAWFSFHQAEPQALEAHDGIKKISLAPAPSLDIIGHDIPTAPEAHDGLAQQIDDEVHASEVEHRPIHTAPTAHPTGLTLRRRI